MRWDNEVYSSRLSADLVGMSVTYRLNNKKYVKNTNCATSIQWKIYDCELCKTRFPNEVGLNGRMFEICEIERPAEGPYLLLESIPTSSTSYKSKVE